MKMLSGNAKQTTFYSETNRSCALSLKIFFINIPKLNYHNKTIISTVNFECIGQKMKYFLKIFSATKIILSGFNFHPITS